MKKMPKFLTAVVIAAASLFVFGQAPAQADDAAGQQVSFSVFDTGWD